MALRRLAEEDPTFKVEVDDKLGQTKIRGMGELHLEVLVDRMMREFGVQATVGRPRVAYRETHYAQVARIDTTFKRQTGGSGQYARVVIEFEPLTDEEIAEMQGRLHVGGRDSRRHDPARSSSGRPRTASAKRCRAACWPGIRSWASRRSLVDGAFHEVDSSEMAFKIAGSMCLKEGVQKGKPVLLEPTMKVEVNVPEEYTGTIVGDLSARRGMIAGMEPRGAGATVIHANVPLGEMFGYATNLRNMTQGRGSFTMEFEKYSYRTAEHC